MPISAGPMRLPAFSRGIPDGYSSPMRMMLLSGRTAVGMKTLPPFTSVSSAFKTAFAPSGTGAPVKMRMAVPGSSGSRHLQPAADSPWMVSSPGTSSARKAKPSKGLLSKGGIGNAARISSARIRSSASSSGTVSFFAESGWDSSSMAACSQGISFSISAPHSTPRRWGKAGYTARQPVRG